MKVLMVCTYPHGGATIAARRQATALNNIGKNCSLVSIKEIWDTSDIFITRENHEITINVPASSWSYSGRITTAYCNNNRTDISNTWFSFWPYETFLDQTLLDICLEFDVIHFHWIAQMVSSRLLARLAAHGRRIVFTGHDMNHFTGGCHYSAGCEHYKQDCSACPQLLVDPLNLVANSFHQKTSSLAALPATWLFPSIWLANAFRQSKLQNSPDATKVLYNCIDTKKFHYLQPEKRATCRLEFGFADNEMVFVAGAVDNTELRKGFDYIESSVRHLSSVLDSHAGASRYCTIITFGRGEPTITAHSPYIRHLHLGSINEAKVITLFQAADLLLFPSVEENFSNTILESLMCGCPVLAFRIGGVPDIVEHGINGWIIDNVSHSEFGAGLVSLAQSERLAELRQSTHRWHDQQADQYSYPNIARELIDVYQDSTAVAQPQIFRPPVNIVPTVPLYTALFNKVIADDANSHSLLAANIAKHINFAKDNNTLLDKSNNLLSIPAIFRGFSDAGEYEPVGRISWLMSKGHVFFKVDSDTRPALCLQVPNIDWVIDFLNTALTRLNATVNGTPAEVSCIKAEGKGKYTYVWIAPEPTSLVPDTYNTLCLSFSEPSVSESKDPRGLCILHNQASLFDLNKVTVHTGASSKPDFNTSTTLALKAAQSHYIWQEWTTETNTEANLRNSMETWVDLLHDGITMPKSAS